MDAATDTIELFQERLRRVEHVIYGSSSHRTPSEETETSAATRLRQLERSLATLASRSPVVSNILALQQTQPSIFSPDTNSDIPPNLPLSTLAALVLAHSSLYHSASANLQSLQDTTLPDSNAFAKLTQLQSRIEELRVKQLSQLDEVNELRVRSARAVERWYENGVLDMGEKWADWEERLREVEILVRRREAAKKREEAGII